MGLDELFDEFEFMEDLVDDTDEEEGAIFCGKRYRIKGLNGTNQYVMVDDNGIMVTFPDNKPENLNYQCTATALTRVISVALQAGVDMMGIKKQLKESSAKSGDTPSILLTAINLYEGKINENK